MGSTISTAKLVAAFPSVSGAPFYVMYEESYESNVHPRTPRWSCVALGSLERIMRRIFASGSSCEGGMLKGSSGRDISPEAYISGWLKELANPVICQDHTITLEAGNSWRSAIPDSELENTMARLVSLGRQDIATELEEKKSIKLSLHAESALIEALYVGGSMSPWRIIPDTSAHHWEKRIPELGYAPAKTKVFDVKVPRFYKINPNEHNRLILDEGGQWRCAGWDYSIVGSYVVGLWESEMLEPGSYRTRIKAYREALKGSPYLPKLGVKIVIDTSVELKGWQKSTLDKVFANVPHNATGSQVRLDVPEDSSDLYSVFQLNECITWEVRECDAAEQPCLTQQLCLLAG
ncbi:hypothetical protein GIW05_00405 [Pseudomonas syringae]|uniref:hypothetical protein n=1 Tax=Pseudomonas syringae TaxID=317 RepID=UPI001F310360|nr:hypothetical protein [Pseudomonas syringae]MCF5381983.1 hypothetical protein [Pseudomonas syringae]MCF5419485.1 hypothetical protein [Pseudomonas syringae]MCF5454841.1 hypothetical protein [Pseudomonas syringae]MCF5456317.1 hypothetical protein [Pseudomonas syringae]